MMKSPLFLLLSLGLAASLCCIYVSRPPLADSRPVDSVGSTILESFSASEGSSGPAEALFVEAPLVGGGSEDRIRAESGLAPLSSVGRRVVSDENLQARGAGMGSSNQESGAATTEAKRAYDPNAEPTQILAVIDGDGSGFTLGEDQLGGLSAHSVSKNEIALRDPSTNEQTKVNALAQLTGAYAEKSKEVHFLQEIARDLKQPDSVRVGAFLKLADFGTEQVAAFEQTEDNVIRLEVELWKRLKEFERQEGIPSGSLRASSQ
jgi:hypothetical protein